MRWLSKHINAFRVWQKPVRHKFVLVLIAITMAVTQVIPFIQPQVEAKRYDLSDVKHLLPRSSDLMAGRLQLDTSTQTYEFNKDYSPSSTGTMDNGGYKNNGGPKYKASASTDASKGVTVTDPMSNVNFTLTPKMDLLPARQDSNRIYYPLKDNTGWLVYTMQSDQVAEDLVLTKATDDKLEYKYDLGLGDTLAARLLRDGSVGIYGSELPISGQVSTGSDADAELLAKVRKSSAKNKLLFTLPAPIIRQSKSGDTNVKANFTLKGSELTLHASGLKTGQYPISIDPSVYVQSARGLMYGNNETNINFDTTNNLFQKTTVSGGNIRNGTSTDTIQSSWTTSTALPTGLWNSAVVISGGYIYVIGGTTSGGDSSNVYWAQLNRSTSQAIGPWTTNSNYSLPSARTGASVVAYNSVLYLIGGVGLGTNEVYSIRLAASGEPTPSWTLQTNTMPASRTNARAVAYQNQIYVIGGLAGLNATATTYTAALNPDGSVGTWSTISGLPAGRFNHDVLSYNGYLYTIGGLSGAANSATPQNTIYYAKILSPGVIGAWQTNPTNLSTSRFSSGGTFSTIWAGYMYLSGGCSAVVAGTSRCSTILGDTQIASVNADGSIGTWTGLQTYNTTTDVFIPISQPRTGFGLVSFGTANNPSAADAGGTLYSIGGCATAPDSSNNCPAPLTTTTKANISSEGDLGPARTTSQLPTTAGAYSAAIVVNNGYIYNIGGCAYQATGTNTCGTTNATVWYARLNADGTLGVWTQTTSLGANRAAAGATVFNNVLYVMGGGTGTGNPPIAGYYGAIAQNGTIAAFTAYNAYASATTTSALYPFVFSTNTSTVGQGYIYGVGGCRGTSGVGCSSYLDATRRCTVSVATPAPTACTDVNTLPESTGIAAGAVHGNYVYLSSGANDSTSTTPGSSGGQTNITYYSRIAANGTLTAPPGKTAPNGWATLTAKLADNNVSYTTNAAVSQAGQRRRAAAFGVNGYLYVLAGHDGLTSASGTGQTLQDVEIGKINPTTGDIASFVDNYYQITPRWDFKGAAANGYIYAVGGCSNGAPPAACTAQDRAVQYMQIYNNNSGTPASYTAASNAMPNTVAYAGSAIYNGRIYVAGGNTTYNTDAGVTNNVQSAPVAADGSIGTWTASAGTMTQARNNFQITAYKGYLYALGGQSTASITSATNTTERAVINNDGTLGAFSVTTSMNSQRSGLDIAVYNGYIYATGGVTAAAGYLTTVEHALINPSTGAIGTWTTNTANYTTGRDLHSAVAYSGALYIVGGYNGTNFLSDVQYAQINANGTIGTFSTAQGLPQAVGQASAFAANGYLYVVAGRSSVTVPSATSCTNNTYVAPFNANSTVAAGNTPNGIGNWTQTAVSFTGARYGATATYADGKAYLFGGMQCASNALVAAGQTTYYGTMQSQPQVAEYSYAIDALYDVFPSKSLFNGIDNGIGANWVLNYRSSTDADKVWGQNTSYGKTTLGTPQPYIPINGVGTNTNFARYYWINLSIDASQAFGYPEDVSRGPTIANLTLQFTANPSQRLRNGKTFINNVEQPLDAPF